MEEKFQFFCFSETWFKFITLHAIRRADPPPPPIMTKRLTDRFFEIDIGLK